MPGRAQGAPEASNEATARQWPDLSAGAPLAWNSPHFPSSAKKLPISFYTQTLSSVMFSHQARKTGLILANKREIE